MSVTRIIPIAAPVRQSDPAASGQKASGFEAKNAAAGVKPGGGELGPKQLAWLRENIPSFDDGERRARQTIADTARMKREVTP